MSGPLDGGVQEPLPVVVAQRPQPHLHPVRPRPAALYVGEDQAGRHGDGVDVPPLGIAAPAGQPGRVQGAFFQRAHPRVPPPGRGEALVRRAGRERGEGAAEVAVAVRGGHRAGGAVGLRGGDGRGGVGLAGGGVAARGRGGGRGAGLPVGRRVLGGVPCPCRDGGRPERCVGRAARRALPFGCCRGRGVLVLPVRLRRQSEGVRGEVPYGTGAGPGVGGARIARGGPGVPGRGRASPGVRRVLALGVRARLPPRRTQGLSCHVGRAGVARVRSGGGGGRRDVGTVRCGGVGRRTGHGDGAGVGVRVEARVGVVRAVGQGSGSRLLGLLGVGVVRRRVPCGPGTAQRRAGDVTGARRVFPVPAAALVPVMLRRGLADRGVGLRVGAGPGRGVRGGVRCRLAAQSGLAQGAAGLVGGAGGHDGLRRDTRSDSSRAVSSVRADSPEPRIASARARLDWSISAIRSSTVPSVMRRCTWTGWVWPMR